MRLRGMLPGDNQPSDVVLAGDRIAAIGPPQGTPDLGGADLHLGPGLIDLQVNGCGGHDFNVEGWTNHPVTPETGAAIAALLAAAGTTQFLPTLVTNSPENLLRGLRAIAAGRRQDPAMAQQVPGVHLEGPFVSPDDGPRGAHELRYVQEPSWDAFCRWQEAAEGLVKVLTIAPERPGAVDLIRRAVASGVICSIGHSNPTADDIRAAIDAGASMSTHLGNGSHAVLPRHPNYIWEQLAADELVASVMADAQHLPPSVLKCFARIKGERLCVVSDAVALAGLPPGLYDHGRHEVLPSGRVNLAGTPYLAGAGHLLDTGLANLRRLAELSEPACFTAAAALPARLLGQTDNGRLEVGCRADLILFRWPAADGPIAVHATLVAGAVRYRA
ncbi:MAG: amidohydrolase family protein [Fimbriimonadaceae bacterium]|nr:amidohydrolase family protein [Fimbriimonadaceae bacterium]